MIKIEKDKLGLQDYFYIGYLYLIILGIVSDAIFYGIFGVSYLNYTTILDALISPISLLTNNWHISLILTIMFWLMYMYFNNWIFKLYAYLRVKKWYQKIYNIEKWDKKYEKLAKKENKLIGLMFIFFLLFVSMRTGMALGTKSKYANKEIIPNYTLVFKDNTKLDVRKVGQNSAYFFYFIPGEEVITATPIADNLKQIKVLKNKKK
jgi:ABC-type transport system involved in multi-copper enzyme maturation permease subunit